MSEVVILTVTPDELEAAQLVCDFSLSGTPAVVPSYRRGPLQTLAGKITRTLERSDSATSIEQLQAALETLHDAGLLTLAGPGVPANFAAAVSALKDAAEFYADHSRYDAIEVGEAHTAGCGPGDPRILIDRGARARRALRLEGATQ